MPRLSDTMEEGTILRWLVGDGETVARGQELVEIETDKATMTYESDQDGVVEIVAEEGSTLEVGAVIARVGDATEGSPQNATHVAPVPGARGEPPPREQARAQTPAPPSGAPAGERVRASPLARRIARERGVDLRALAGSGPGGRIVKADVTADGRRRRRRSRSRGPRGGWRHSRALGPRARIAGRGGDGEGRDDNRRADTHPAGRRAADGRVEGDDPGLRAERGRRHGGLRDAARAAARRRQAVAGR